MILRILSVAAVLASAPATAENVTADPLKLAAAMQAAGYQAELGKDNTGDPMITSAAAGTKFVVLFYNCKDHANCLTIQFQTAWTTKNKPALATINDWNHGNRFGRGYIDKEGDPGIMMDVDLDKGGMSSSLFQDNLEVWATVISKFARFIAGSPR